MVKTVSGASLFFVTPNVFVDQQGANPDDYSLTEVHLNHGGSATFMFSDSFPLTTLP